MMVTTQCWARTSKGCCVASFDNKADAADSRDAIKAKYAPNFQDAWLLERAY